MAKQSISPIERHLEKALVGVAGLVLAAMAALFLFGSPNGVEIDGEKRSPGAVGARIKEDARAAYQAVVNAPPPKPAPLPNFVAMMATSRPVQIDPQLAKALPVPPAPLNAAPPAAVAARRKAGTKAKLAQVLAPGKPIVIQGRNRATLAEPTLPQALQTGVGGGEAAAPVAGEGVPTKDLTWVTVAAPVFRAQQTDEFTANGYTLARARLLLVQVRLERQMLQGDGTWSEPEAVATYGRFKPFSPPRINLVQGDNGWAVEGDPEAIQRFLQAVSDPATQQSIWRPPLAPYIDAFEWPPADTALIADTPWQQWLGTEAPASAFKGPALASLIPEPAPVRERPTREVTPKAEKPAKTPTARESGSGSGRGSPKPESTKKEPKTPSKTTVDRAAESKARTEARRKADENLKAAETALKGRKPEAAMDLVNRVLADQELLDPKQVAQAENLSEQIKAELEKTQARTAQLGRAGLGPEGVIDNYPDIEPIWAHDLTAQPGATYRYRLQFDAYNQYLGYPTELLDPSGAAKPVLASLWSEWSEPVEVRPAAYFFFLRPATPGDNQVTLDVYAWIGGLWRYLPGKKFEIGQRVACDYEYKPQGLPRQKEVADTGITIIDIEYNASRPVRARVRKDGGFDTEVRETQVLVVADAQGMVRERFSADDKNNPDLARLKKEMEEQTQPRERTFGAPTPGGEVRPPLRGPGLPPAGARELER